MARKTVGFNQMGAARLPNDKPVVYKIQTAGGKTNYVGDRELDRSTAKDKTDRIEYLA